MAKRLNKKVALIGSAVLALLILAAMAVILRMGRDPQKFINDGDAALLVKDYERAERSYNKARGLAKTDVLKVEMLFKLIDVYRQTDNWRNILGCWNATIQIDPKNIGARLGRLEYVYIAADSSQKAGANLSGSWQEVASQAADFINVADANVLAADTAKWSFWGTQKRLSTANRIGPYLYLLRGRATLETARLGAVTDPNESLDKAVVDLRKVCELEPNNVDAYMYLAQAAIAKGEILVSKGNFGERAKAAEKAEKFLEQAVQTAPDNPAAQINLLAAKPTFSRLTNKALTLLEPEYLALAEKLASNAEVFALLTNYYLMLGPKNLDKAMAAAEKTYMLDKENVAYAITAARLHYRQFSIYRKGPELYKAIQIAQDALNLPGVQDKPGPRQWANRMRRIQLYDFIAGCCTEQALEPFDAESKSKKQDWLAEAEKAVHQINQLLGSGEDPSVVKWRGMLELAKGNKNAAVKKLYTAYEQLKAAGGADPQLSYTLAGAFKDTAEVGAVAEFLASAINSGITQTKPDVILDYTDAILRLNLGLWTEALSNINLYDENFGANSKSRILRIKAYIGANQFDEAEKELANANLDDANTTGLNIELLQYKIMQVQRAILQRQMRKSSEIIWGELGKKAQETESSDELITAELKGYKNALAQLVDKLLKIKPDLVTEAPVAAVYNNYLAEKKIEQAGDLINRYLQSFPDNTTAIFYRQMLSEPDLNNVSEQRRKAIEETVLAGIGDPLRRAANLGAFYQRNSEPNKAVEEYKKALDIPLEQTAAASTEAKAEEKINTRKIAAGYLFDIAVKTKNFALAEKTAEKVKQENLDDCEGRFFAASLAFAKGQYKDALAEINECLKQKPVFSLAFILRSNINSALGNENTAIEDARKASSLNPMNDAAAKILMKVLYDRNQKLGSNVTPNQTTEFKIAFDRALALNPDDLDLLSFYAEYIVPTEPLRALAIRQNLQKTAPSSQNAILLGRLAAGMAAGETDPQHKEALFAIADSSFEQAEKMAPHDAMVLSNCAAYYRMRGQGEKAEQLLHESGDKKVLWQYYFNAGRLDEAKKILEQLRQENLRDSNVPRGLMLVSQELGDSEGVKKYSEEALAAADNLENRLLQIQTFLKIGLVREAENKLQSFKEKYPDEPRGLLLEAWLAMKQGRSQKALELVNHSLERNQDSAVAWRVRGEINLFIANYDQAVDDLKKSKALSDEPAIRVSLAKAYFQAGRTEDAITELKSVIDSPQAPAEARFLLEQIYSQLGRKEELRKFYDETIQMLPNNLLWYNRAAALALARNDFTGAEQLYGLAWQKSLQQGKGDITAFDGYLDALLRSGQADKVFEQAAKYVDGDFAPIAYLRMAEAKLKSNDKAVSLQYCRKALDKAFAGTNQEFAADILLRTYSLLGADETLKYCEDKLKAGPNSPVINLAMFNLMRSRGDYNKAVGYIDKCVEIAGPNSPGKTDYTIRKAMVLQLAYVKTSDKNYLNKAIAEHESLLAEMPNNIDVLNNLAYILAENGEKLDKALEYAKRAYDAKPNSPDFMDTYAYVLYKNGQFKEAANFLLLAIQQYEAQHLVISADVYEHLGMIKEKLGLAKEALAAYEQALNVGKNDLSQTAKQRIEETIKRLSQ
jgi:tetratricopeptide (TPR) repeat protein